MKMLGHGKKDTIQALYGHKASVNSVAVTDAADGKRKLISGSEDGQIKVWCLENMTCLKTFDGQRKITGFAPFDESKRFLGQGGYNNDAGRRFISAHDDGSIQIFDIDTMSFNRSFTSGRSRCSNIKNSVAVIAEGKGVLSASDNNVKIFNFDTHHCLLDNEVNAEVSALLLFDDGRRFVTGCCHGSIKVYLTSTMENVSTKPATAAVDDNSRICCFAAYEGADGANRLVSGSADGKMKIWHLETMECTSTLDGHGGAAVNSVDVALYGKGGGLRSLVSGSDDGTIMIWSLETMTCARTLKENESVNCLRVINNGEKASSRLVSTSGCDIKLWDDLNATKCVTLKGHKSFVICVAVSGDDGKRLVTGDSAGIIKVWDKDEELNTMKCVQTSEGHEDGVNCVTLYDDGKRLVSGFANGVIKIWELNETKLICKKSLPGGHSDAINGVAIIGNGTMLLSASSDRSIKVWELSVFLSSLPPAVRYVYELEREISKNTRLFAWPMTTALFHEHPNRLLDWHWTETSNSKVYAMLSDKKKNYTFLHVVCEEGRADLLKLLLEHQHNTGKTAKERAKETVLWTRTMFAACMVRDSRGHTPLKTAMEKKRGPCVQVLFRFFKKFFGDANNIMVDGMQSQGEVHLSDAFPISDLCEALQDFPAYASDFIEKSPLLPSYPEIVMGKLNLFDMMNKNQIVLGSVDRSPRNFWMDMLYPQDNIARLEHAKLATSIKSRERRTSSVQRNWKVPKDGYMEDEVEQIGEPVIAKLVPFKGIAAQPEFLRSVIAACDELQKYTLCESETVSSLIQFKWDEYVEPQFRTDLCLYILLVLFFSYDALAYRLAPQANFKEWDAVQQIFYMIFPMSVSIMLSIYFARHEAKQWIAEKVFIEAKVKKKLGRKDEKIRLPNLLRIIWWHFSADLWNMLDGMTLLSIFFTYVFRMGGINDANMERWSVIFQGLALPLVYLNTLFYLQGFDKSGELVRMIVGIIKGIWIFLIIMFDVVIGFALSFYVLNGLDSDERPQLLKNGPLDKAFNVYTLMLGEIDEADYNKRISLAFLFTVFTLLTNIVLLNLLIALMGDIFNRIQENAQAEFLYARAYIVLEFESLLDKNYKNDHPEKFPEWLQVLVHASSGDDDDNSLAMETWKGKMKAIRKGQEAVAEEVGRVKMVMKEGQDSVKAEVKKEIDALKGGQEAVKVEVQRMKEALEGARDAEEKVENVDAQLKGEIHPIKLELKRTQKFVKREMDNLKVEIAAIKALLESINDKQA